MGRNIDYFDLSVSKTREFLPTNQRTVLPQPIVLYCYCIYHYCMIYVPSFSLSCAQMMMLFLLMAVRRYSPQQYSVNLLHFPPPQQQQWPAVAVWSSSCL